MNILSRDEIRKNSEEVQVIYVMQDEWNRKIVDSVILYRPLKEWRRDDRETDQKQAV